MLDQNGQHVELDCCPSDAIFPAVDTESSTHEADDPDRSGDPAATVLYWPGAEPAAGPAPEPFDALTAVSAPVLLRAIEEASRLDESTVGAEHLLLALAGESEGSVLTAFDKLGLTLPAIRHQIAVLLAQAAEQDAPRPDDEPA